MTENTEPGLEPEAGADSVAALDDVLQSAPATQEAPEKPAKEAAPEAKPEKKAEPFWYRKALKEKEDRLKALEREAAELRSRSEQPAQQPQDPQTAYEERILRAELKISERFAKREHGVETFEEARDWLATRPDMEAWALNQEDPWDAAIGAFKREKLAADIGNDPDKWRERERQRIREELEAEMGQSGTFPQAMSQPRQILPTSAAGVRSTGPKGGFTGPTPLGDVLKRK